MYVWVGVGQGEGLGLSRLMMANGRGCASGWWMQVDKECSMGLQTSMLWMVVGTTAEIPLFTCSNKLLLLL